VVQHRLILRIVAEPLRKEQASDTEDRERRH
jgi:hypothetical protein